MDCRFLGKAKVWAGSYEDCADADIIIITAGAAQRPGESRVNLLKRNVAIFESITDEVLKYNSDGRREVWYHTASQTH